MSLYLVVVFLSQITRQRLGPLCVPFVFIDQKFRFKVVNAFQLFSLESVLNLLTAIWVVVLHSFLHLFLHRKNELIFVRAQFLLNRVDLDKEDAIFVE